jgi:hypothetical protein
VTSSTRSSTTRRVLATLAVGLAALAASGCGSGIDAGAAAVDGDRRVSVSDVQTATAEVNRIVSQDGQLDQRTVLSYLITEPYVVAAAAKAGAGVSEDQAREIYQQFKRADAVTGSSTPAPESVRLVRGILALNVLQGRTLAEGDTPVPAAAGQAAVAEIVAQLEDRDITVNPRYGSFEPVFDLAAQKIFPITPATDNWLVPSTERPQPTPSP